MARRGAYDRVTMGNRKALGQIDQTAPWLPCLTRGDVFNLAFFANWRDGHRHPDPLGSGLNRTIEQRGKRRGVATSLLTQNRSLARRPWDLTEAKAVVPRGPQGTPAHAPPLTFIAAQLMRSSAIEQPAQFGSDLELRPIRSATAKRRRRGGFG